MKKLIYILPVFALLSCNEPITPGSMYTTSFVDKTKQSDIRYFKDDETGLCFAERGLGDNYTFTQVECTPAVMSKIITPKK